MVTATTTSSDVTKNGNLDLAYKAPVKTDYANKSASELYKKSDNKSQNTKSTDFKEVLNSKTNSPDKSSEKVENADDSNKIDTIKETADTDKIKELKEKLEELEEDSKEGKPVSNDELKEILSQLLNLLNKLGSSDVELKVDGKFNDKILEAMLKEINESKTLNVNVNSIIDKISELLKKDSLKNNLDSDSLKGIEKLLSDLSANLIDDNSESTKEIKSSLKNLLSQVTNMVDNKQNQSGKIFSLEDILNKNYSQDNSDTSTESGSNDNNAASKDSKVISKEDKFLNSLIDDNKDESLNKINLLASRNSAIQNQGVNAARGLTINKATFVDDLIKDVKYMNTNSLKELTVKINPGNLGEITIRLVQEDGLMKANLKANSKETTALLSQSLVDIKKQLGEQSIKISDVNIELYQDDTTYFTDQGFKGNLSEGQNQQNNTSQNRMSKNQRISNDSLDENLAQDNSNINMFA